MTVKVIARSRIGGVNAPRSLPKDYIELTPKIEKLIEAVKFFCSSDENQIRPTTVRWALKAVLQRRYRVDFVFLPN
jgi:hypothetical protein